MGGNKIAGSPMGGAISSIGGAVGQIGGSLTGGGLESGAGSAISNIGGTIGGVVGAVNQQRNLLIAKMLLLEKEQYLHRMLPIGTH